VEQSVTVGLVARLIALDFVFPVINVGFRNVTDRARMAMPEASIDEDSYAIS
jgi:hypothetical protein